MTITKEELEKEMLGGNTQFTCPECGSHHFGSYGNHPFLTRSCHTNSRGCDFEWSQADDYKYFSVLVRVKETMDDFLIPSKPVKWGE